MIKKILLALAIILITSNMNVAFAAADEAVKSSAKSRFDDGYIQPPPAVETTTQNGDTANINAWTSGATPTTAPPKPKSNITNKTSSTTPISTEPPKPEPIPDNCSVGYYGTTICLREEEEGKRPPTHRCYMAEQFRGSSVPKNFRSENIQGIYAEYDCIVADDCAYVRSMSGMFGNTSIYHPVTCPPRTGDECRVRHDMQTGQEVQPDPSCFQTEDQKAQIRQQKEQQKTFAQDYLKTITLPTPTPVLTPKGAKNPGLRTLCGLRAYLDTGIEGTITYEEKETPFGPLTVKAVPTYKIDWQDKRTGIQEYSEYSSIYHYWENKGTYDITVTVDWEVKWSFAQNSGTIEGLQTQAVVNDYQVLEAYAIITE